MRQPSTPSQNTVQYQIMRGLSNSETISTSFWFSLFSKDVKYICYFKLKHMHLKTFFSPTSLLVLTTANTVVSAVKIIFPRYCSVHTLIHESHPYATFSYQLTRQSENITCLFLYYYFLTEFYLVNFTFYFFVCNLRQTQLS